MSVDAGVRLARPEEGPLRQVARRLVVALGVLVVMVVVVYLDRGGYRDSAGGEVGLLDATYYSTVSLSTTGYGDIVPVTSSARLLNILLVTPLRILFLLILIGTTLEALTERSREELRVQRWRSRLHDHVVICGFGTKGRSAAIALRDKGTPASRIVVVDPDPQAVAEANGEGMTGIVGDATRMEVLRRAEVGRARAVIVAANRDDAAVLTTLTVRQLAADVPIAAAVREAENASLLRQSGADSVITSSEASGRLLGLSTDSPRLVSVVEDLLVFGEGLDMVERPVNRDELGRPPRELADLVLAVVRSGRLLRFDAPDVAPLRPGDSVVCVRARPADG